VRKDCAVPRCGELRGSLRHRSGRLATLKTERVLGMQCETGGKLSAEAAALVRASVEHGDVHAGTVHAEVTIDGHAERSVSCDVRSTPGWKMHFGGSDLKRSPDC